MTKARDLIRFAPQVKSEVNRAFGGTGKILSPMRTMFRFRGGASSESGSVNLPIRRRLTDANHLQLDDAQNGAPVRKH